MSPSVELLIHYGPADKRGVLFPQALRFPSPAQYSYNSCLRSHLMLTFFFFFCLAILFFSDYIICIPVS